MKKKKANIIRSILLNKINNEIISIIKRNGKMRINGKTQEDIYKTYSGNYEILIIHKLTTGNSLNQFIKIKNALTLNLDITSFEINNLEGLNNIENLFHAKKIISEKKLSGIPELKIKEKDNYLIKDEKKRAKEGFIKLRTIIKHLINRNNTIINNFDNSKNYKKNNPKKTIKTIFKNRLKKMNVEECNVNNISHKIPSHNYNLDDIMENKYKKKKLNPSFSQIYKNDIKDKNIVVNQNKRRSIFMQKKLDINKLLKLNNSNLDKTTPLSSRNKKSSNSLLYGNK